MSFANALNAGLNLGTTIASPFATWQQRQRENQMFPLQVQSLKASIAGEEQRTAYVKQQTKDLSQITDIIAKYLGGGDADPSLETAFVATQEALRTIGSGRSVLSGLQQDVGMQYGARSPQPAGFGAGPQQRPTAFSPLLQQIQAQQVNATAGMPALSAQPGMDALIQMGKAKNTATIDALLANGPLSAQQMASMDDETLSRLETYALGIPEQANPLAQLFGGAMGAPFQAAEWALGPLANILDPAREQRAKRAAATSRMARIREVLRLAEEKRRSQTGQAAPWPSMSAAPRP